MGELAVTLDDIRQAAVRIRPLARVTPLLTVEDAGVGTRPLALKCENLQRSGAFKIRGAANMLLQLAAEERERGVITFSSGNHGIAMSLAASCVGCPAIVVMPTTASAVKVEIARTLGAEVIFEGTTTTERKARAEAEAAARGLTIVPPFDHEWIIAGQGTIGLEILEQVPDVAADLRADQRRRPALRRGDGHQEPGAARPRRRRGAAVHAAHDAFASRRPPGHGRRVAGIADGLLAVRPGDITFAHVQAYVDEIVTVEDDAIVDAVRWLFDHARLVVEPSGAATVAAVLSRGRRPGRATARSRRATSTGPPWRSQRRQRRDGAFAGTSQRGRSNESA